MHELGLKNKRIKFSQALLKKGALATFTAVLMAVVPASSQTKVIKALDFKFCGPSGFVHSTIASGAPYLITLGTLLGGSSVFTVDTTSKVTDLNAANLAKYNVLIMNNNTDIGDALNASEKAALQGFTDTAGIVAMHGAADSHQAWAWWDSLTGAVFADHQQENGSIYEDSLAVNGADTNPISAGLGTHYRDTFQEEWYSMQSNPTKSTGLGPVTVLTDLDESTMSTPPTTKMGSVGDDHPVSWTRVLKTGGRFYYNIVGHLDYEFSPNNTGSNLVGSTWYRRQLYNAVLWAGFITDPLPVSVRQNIGSMLATTVFSVVQSSVNSLRVSFKQPLAHKVEIMDLNGRLAGSRSGSGIQSYTFGNLQPHTEYAVVVTMNKLQKSQLVMVP